MIGTEVFALPSALAVYGPISLVALVLVTIGAMPLALTLGTLSKRIPGSGCETASVVAGRIRNPIRNVARATILGTIGCALVSILGTLTGFGTVPNTALKKSTAPFTDSANAIFGGQ